MDCRSGNIVFFGGAGVSTESGIPDFRSVDGLYSQKYDYPPETILSHSFLSSQARGILPVLSRQDDHPGCAAQQDPHPSGRAGKRGQAESGRPPRTSTGSTSWPGANGSWSSTAPPTGTTACAAERPTAGTRWPTPGACPNVPAAASSGRMWCCTRRGWTAP